MITKEQARRLAEVATAIAEGKRVTYVGDDGVVWDAADRGRLVFRVEYTIHEPPPEPKWRPWTLEEAIDNIGRVVRSGNDRAARLIVAAHDYEGDVMIRLGGLGVEYATTTAEELLVRCQFLDGTPCGVRE